MNIFARELVLILGRHGKELSNLFGLRVPVSGQPDRLIPPAKVTRLKRSLSEDLTATLNTDEMEALRAWVPLDPAGEDLARLRAALVAEAVRHLLAGRVAPDEAAHLGDTTLQLLIGQDSRELAALRDKLVQTVRGDTLRTSEDRATIRGVGEIPPAPQDDALDERIQHALDPAAEAYEQGALWLEIARDTQDRSARAGYVALATALLQRASDLAKRAPTVALDTPQQRDWVALIATALNEADYLR